MAKEDVKELPARIPRKRNQIESLLDVHIAVWLAGDTITAKERKLLVEEKERRKRLNPSKVICILTHKGGVSPEQLKKLREILDRHQPITEVRATQPLRLALRTKYSIVSDLKEMMKDADLVIAAAADGIQREMPANTDEFWDHVGYAKHRKVPVTVVLHNGSSVV